jgi:mono/diheme cytochrome c family protein
MGVQKIYLMALLGVLTSCGGNDSSTSKQTSAARSGKEIYTSICTACHGADGKAGTNGAADLSKSNLNAAGMAYIIENGSLSGKMASYKGILHPAEIQAVAEFAATLKKP